ncbi:hypothetical protein BH10BAC6_BH10BAC6_16610 [soil metagenome]
MANELLRTTLLLPVRLWLRRRSVELPIDLHSVHRILVLRYDAIGDMIVTTALFAVLKRLMPNVVIDVVASPKNVTLLDDDERVNRAMVYDRSFKSMMNVRSQCRDVKYDVVLSFVFNKTTESGLAAALWGGRLATVVSILHEAREHHYSAWFNVQVPIERNTMTMAAMQIEVANALFGWSVDAVHEPIDLRISDERRTRAAHIVHRPTNALHIIINLSAGNWYRQWSEQRNEELIRLLRSTFPNVVCSLMADPTRTGMATIIASKFDSNVRAIPGIDDLLTVVAATGEADVVISPDTSIVHAASNMGTPVVVMYTQKATFINEWMPHGVPYRAVLTNEREELEAIEPQRVVDAVQDLLRSLER